MNVSIIGTGYVGLVTGSCLASIGHKVLCMDNDSKKIKNLSRGKPIIYEDGLDSLMAQGIEQGYLDFTTSIKDAIKFGDIIFITVGTPDDGSGYVNLKYIKEVAKEISFYISSYKIIVNKSTVPVGTTKLVKEIIENSYKGSFDVVSSPEFLREGIAIRDFFNPDRIILGIENQKNTKLIKKFFKLYSVIWCEKVVTDTKSAELIKYVSNAFLATKISFMNRVADICELVGANIDYVTKGVGLDKRIGSSFLKVGLGYGGSCFPKDTNALLKFFQEYKLDFPILEGTIKINESRVNRFLEELNYILTPIQQKTIAVLGVSFKAGTDDLRDSKGLDVVRGLYQFGAKVKVYDSLALDNFSLYFPTIEISNNISDTILGADAIIILVNDYEILNFGLDGIKKCNKNAFVFDWRNAFSKEKAIDLGLKYFSIGR